MLIFPAIDLIGGKAVRLYNGDYGQMTVYSDDPAETAMDFASKGAGHIHIVDLDGAKKGEPANFETVIGIKEKTGLFCEIGGGIRGMETVCRYTDAGLDRVILGTAALTDRAFLGEALGRYGEKIAVGVDIRDGFVAIRGWLEKSGTDAFEFCSSLAGLGVKTLICTDISKDGAMKGTNLPLYRKLSAETDVRITASGGVSGMDDIRALKDMGLYAAIIGKAYYTGAIDLKEAIEAAET